MNESDRIAMDGPSHAALFGKNVIALLLAVAAALWAATLVAVAIYQAFNYYTPVPVWDMWNGYLQFYQRAMTGDWSVWWSQHNEHRIFLPRVTFWLDIRIFHGTNVFLLVLNYVLVALIAATFWIVIRKRLALWPSVISLNFCFFVTGWLFLLCQGENLLWAFQGVFFMVFLLPVWGLLLLHRPGQQNVNRDFILACACGALACGCMANGVLALPLMTASALVGKQKFLRVGILAVLSVVMSAAYFIGYQSPTIHSPLYEIFHHPGRVFAILLILLGNVFYYVIDTKHGYFIAEVFGGIFLLAAINKGVRILRNVQSELPHWAIFNIVLFVLISTVAAAGGRVAFGKQQALTTHYTTPAIIGWAALVALYCTDIARSPMRLTIAAIAAIVLGTFMLRMQKSLITRPDEVFFQRKVAILAMSMGVEDVSRFRILTAPDFYRDILPIADKAITRRDAIFGNYPYREAHEQMGTSVSAASAQASCVVKLNNIKPITDLHFAEVDGWILNRGPGRQPTAIRIIDKARRVVGYGIAGEPRPDLQSEIGSAAKRAGYNAYVSEAGEGSDVEVQGEDTRGVVCGSYVRIPEMAFVIKKAPLDPAEINVDTSALLPGNDWTGGDFFQTNMKSLGLRLFGSYKKAGDGDIGSISLRVHKGASIFYRSGPTFGKQMIEFAGLPPVVLPVSMEWSVLQFSETSLPADFVVKITDEGKSWGEWSAIAVRGRENAPEQR